MHACSGIIIVNLLRFCNGSSSRCRVASSSLLLHVLANKAHLFPFNVQLSPFMSVHEINYSQQLFHKNFIMKITFSREICLPNHENFSPLNFRLYGK